MQGRFQQAQDFRASLGVILALAQVAEASAEQLGFTIQATPMTDQTHPTPVQWFVLPALLEPFFTAVT